jgi:hypothetical protein
MAAGFPAAVFIYFDGSFGTLSVGSIFDFLHQTGTGLYEKCRISLRLYFDNLPAH